MLYIVATPIGNLNDMSLRAIDVLNSVDIVACEDTRHTKILLDKFNIKTKLIAYHKFNEKNSSEGILKLLKEGKTVALVSDAGMPLISDPGAVLVARLQQENLDYTVIPGANALLCALVLSGFDSSKFAFFGFLSEKNKERASTIKQIAEFKGTSILYSSKHNINEDLAHLRTSLNDRNVCVVNEISKVFEKKLFFKLSSAVVENPAGEYVIVIDKPFDDDIAVKSIDINQEIDTLVANGQSINDACKQLAKEHNLPKRDVYNNYLKYRGN